MAPPLLPRAALAAAALAGAAAAGEPPEHPVLVSGDEEWMEFRGGIEAGVRAVTEKEGRYAEDVNLDGGFRLLDARIEGTALRTDLSVDAFSLRLTGLGDPNTLADLRLRGRDSFDLRLFADRQEVLFRSAGDAHPLDTVRERTGGSLDLHLSRNVVLHLAADRLLRSGEGPSSLMTWDIRSLPVAATLDHEGHTRSVGLDGTAGRFRWGASWTAVDATDDSFRTFDQPNAPVDDVGVYRNESDLSRNVATGRVGWRSLRGGVEFDLHGGWNAARTDSVVYGREATATPFPPGDHYSDRRARTEVDLRGWSGRADLLLRPGEDVEVLVRGERTSESSRGSGDSFRREQSGPFDPDAPYFPEPADTRGEADLARAGVEGRWRASREWRFRLGGEEVRRELVHEYDDADTWDPKTFVATAGADWDPAERVDGSLLVRAARSRGEATALSVGEGEALSARLRWRPAGGWRTSAFARLRSRTQDDADAVGVHDAWGATVGHEDEGGFVECTLGRQDYRLATDTRYTVSLATTPFKTAHRVRYEEEVLAGTLDVSRRISGPLRAFGSVRAARGSGDYGYAQGDVAFGLGWRVDPRAELRCEARRVAWDEEDRGRDDYDVRLLTLSLLYEF